MPKYISHVEAAKLLTSVDRVSVIGCSGSGKSTLSQSIATRCGMEYQSMDRDVRWLPGWKQREKPEQRVIIARLAQRECWVMDGSSPSTFDIRLPRTDLLLWVRVPRYVSLMGVAKRVVRHLGSVRPERADGCPERLPDREFLSYIWNFEHRSAPLFIRNIDLYGPNVPVVVLKSHREIANLLQMSPCC